jgi:hypothetical protein
VTFVTGSGVTNVTSPPVTPVTDLRGPMGGHFVATIAGAHRATAGRRGVTGMAEKKVSPKKSGAKSSRKAATRVTKKTSLRRRRRR